MPRSVAALPSSKPACRVSHHVTLLPALSFYSLSPGERFGVNWLESYAHHDLGPGNGVVLPAQFKSWGCPSFPPGGWDVVMGGIAEAQARSRGDVF